MESIPTTANNNIGPADLSEDEVVQTLRDDFKQTREFLRLISQLNLKKYIRFEKEADYEVLSVLCEPVSKIPHDADLTPPIGAILPRWLIDLV